MPLLKTSQDTFRQVDELIKWATIEESSVVQLRDFRSVQLQQTNRMEVFTPKPRVATCVDRIHNRYARGPYGRVLGALNEKADDNLYRNHPSQDLSLPSQTSLSSVAVVKKSGYSNIATCRALRSSKSRCVGDARIRLENLG